MTESADLDRLDILGIFEIDQVIKDRVLFGRPYSDDTLEAKRRRAILWLRHHSSRGWCVDKAVSRK